MKASAGETRKGLEEVWPEVWKRLRRNAWLFDQSFWLPKRERVEEFLEKSQVDRMKYLPEVSDCDDMALQLYAEAKRVRSILAASGEIPREEWLPWAFGRIMGNEFRGMRMPHAVNWVLTEDSGLLLIEPKDDRIWEPKESHDKPFFLES